jgi:hypothetical protein
MTSHLPFVDANQEASMLRSVTNRWLHMGRRLLCTITIAAPLWAGWVLAPEAWAQAPAQAPAQATAAQSNGSSAAWLLLLLLVVVVVVFLMARSSRRGAPPAKRGLAAKGYFDPAGCMYRKV